jgi:tryptophanyl-tRNA synthetase
LLLSGKSKAEVAVECADMGWGQFKPLLTETTIEALRPIQEKYRNLTEDRSYIQSILKKGQEQAEIVAQKTLQSVKDALGYARPL